MNDRNPYQPPSFVDDLPTKPRNPPEDIARVASVVLFLSGGYFLISRDNLFGLVLVDELFFTLLAGLQLWAAARSWNGRLPWVGILSTFLLCVLVSDTYVASIYCPASLGSVGVLMFTGYIRPRFHDANNVSHD